MSKKISGNPTIPIASFSRFILLLYQQCLRFRSPLKKTSESHLLTGLLTGFATLALTSAALAETVSVTGTKHDLSINPEIEGSLGPCTFCHGAHSSGSQLPLWARSETTSEFTVYASITINADVDPPGNTSLACLSCHDGATAFDAVNGSTGTTGNDMNNIYPDSPAIIGTDLRDDHPVGVSIAADSSGIRNESAITGAGLTIYDGKVECASCHDAHGSDGYIPFLRLAQDDSAMCLACHIK